MSLPYDLDAGLAARGAIGLIVLASDQTIEQEFRSLPGLDGVALFHSRIASDSRITPATLKAMEGRLFQAVDVILPGMPLDVVAFACTSATMVIGEDRVFAEIKRARPDARPTTPLTAAFAAFGAFGARRIALLTPYRDDVNGQLQAHIQARGVDVVAVGSFAEEDDRRVCRISETSIREAAITLGGAPDVEAVFVSCTGLRTMAVVAAIETALDKPVTSSNHALAWHCLRLAGIDDRIEHHGRLFHLDLPAAGRKRTE